MARFLLILLIPVALLVVPRTGARSMAPRAFAATIPAGSPTPSLRSGATRTVIGSQATTSPLTLVSVDCTTIPQTFTVSGDPGAIQDNYPGASLSTNEPATAVSSVALTIDVNGAPLAIPGPTPGPNPLSLFAGGPGNGQEILAQPFVKPGAADAFVSLNVPNQAPQILPCTTTAIPTASRSLTVANAPFGEDIFDCTVPEFQSYCTTFCPSNASTCANNCQSPPSPVACATIQYAIGQARDGDTITVTSTPSPYIINTPIEVPKLVTITSDGNNKVVLESANGNPIFHVTAIGSSQSGQHVTIENLILGGTTSATDPGAIQLDGDSYTTISGNYIGQEDLPNGIGILLRNSDHPTITDNVIYGSTIFTPAPTLQVGAVSAGFGVVTAECLGKQQPSDSITISNNLIASNANAGIWVCSDQGGGHTISGNTIRNNARGIVLFNVVDSTLQNNVLDDNTGDGIQVVGESANDTISTNTIESQTGKDAAGIRLWGNGGIVYPLDTTITGNNLRRNTSDVVIAGARATTLSGNVIEAGDYRTGVLLLVGSTLAGGTTSQPTDTILSGNTILYDGFCTAAAGCAIRLVPGVVVDVDAHSNTWGFPSTSTSEIRTTIWDQSQDPSLGHVFISATPPTAAAGSAPVPTPAPAATPAPTPSPTPTSSGAPAGATGICNDGTYVFTSNPESACTNHSGVRQSFIRP